MRNQDGASAGPRTRSRGRLQRGEAEAEVVGLAALPQEVLANVVAKLPQCTGIQLQRVSRSFWRVDAARKELKGDTLIKLLKVLSADGQSGRAALTACAARRWLARNAAGVKLIHTYAHMQFSGCTSLVSCLPALEDVTLNLAEPSVRDDLGCLLEALAWCPCLKALDLHMEFIKADEGDEALNWPFPDACAFAKLSSLTKLALALNQGKENESFDLADMVVALASLTALVELSLDPPHAYGAVVPSALGQFKGLRSLALRHIGPCVFEAGCLDLPSLETLFFGACDLGDAQVLPGITALQRLTCIEMLGIRGVCVFDPEFAKLPCLQRMVVKIFWLDTEDPDDIPGLIRLPADMGRLSSSLLHLEVSGLVRFPVAVMQLVALKSVVANEIVCSELPAGITALSRLTELTLGRIISKKDPLQLHVKRPLDVRALGDLSAFPALRELTFSFCEVMLCPSMLGAVRHASLASLSFRNAHPAPECAPVVLQLSGELRRMRRGGVVKYESEQFSYIRRALQKARGRAPCQKFAAALEAGVL